MKNNKMNLLDQARYEVLYVMFNENKIFDSLKEAKAYALEYGGKVFVSPKLPVRK